MSSKQSKKDLKQQVAKTLFSTFKELNDKISPKKFKKNIKKASKAIIAGLKIVPEKKAAASKSSAKKDAIKKRRLKSTAK